MAEGKRFAPIQVADGAPVAIIGHGVKTRFFTTEEPIGKPIKVGNVWLTVVGVLEDRKVSDQTSQKLGIRDANMDVYVPLSTMLLRYRNRSLVTEQDVQQASRPSNDGPNANPNANEDAEQRAERVNYHQLDRVIVRVSDAKYVTGVADVLQRMLSRRHNQVIDFEISVPELLLKQQQHTKNIFNGVLAPIASISLIVGGIGIMNIMLASILERIREIGVRRAVGASQHDILAQFLAEAVLISLAGGVAGIILGGHPASGSSVSPQFTRSCQPSVCSSPSVFRSPSDWSSALSLRGARRNRIPSPVYGMSDPMENVLRMTAALLLAGLSTQRLHAQPAQATALTLQDAIAMAQQQGAQAKAAVGARDAARARDRAFSTQYMPLLSVGGQIPAYTRSITPVTQPDGSTLYQPLQQATSALTAMVTQRVPYTNTTFNVISG